MHMTGCVCGAAQGPVRHPRRTFPAKGSALRPHVDESGMTAILGKVTVFTVSGYTPDVRTTFSRWRATRELKREPPPFFFLPQIASSGTISYKSRHSRSPPESHQLIKNSCALLDVLLQNSLSDSYIQYVRPRDAMGSSG